MCVVGIDDDSAGEVPLACVIAKEGHNVTEQEIIKLVGGKTLKLRTKNDMLLINILYHKSIPK